MAQWGLLIDDEICFDCRACEVACMQENNLSRAPWINVVTVGPERWGGTSWSIMYQSRAITVLNRLARMSAPQKR